MRGASACLTSATPRPPEGPPCSRACGRAAESPALGVCARCFEELCAKAGANSGRARRLVADQIAARRPK